MRPEQELSSLDLQMSDLKLGESTPDRTKYIYTYISVYSIIIVGSLTLTIYDV